MCGITGLLTPVQSGLNCRSVIEKMTESLFRRGPDGSGVWVREGIALGHTRLAIIDTSTAAGQPMTDQSGRFVITFNGEIYNYIEIRKELESLGYVFRSQSDTEVLLSAYMEWKSGVFSRLIGMWALAIFDVVEQKLIISRDRFGIKPLFFWTYEDTFIFASTIGAVIAGVGQRPAVNRQVVKSFLLNQAVDQGPETFYEKVFAFTPACFAEIQIGVGSIRVVQQRYWDPTRSAAQEQYRVNTPLDVVAAFREKLVDSVRLHTRSDVEVGSCLSGGLDSSSIVGLLASMSEGRTIHKVFSAVFPGSKYDEAKHSNLVAKNFGLNQFCVEPTTACFLRDIHKVIRAQEQPFGSTGVFVQWKLFEKIQNEGIKVVLDGQGADEYLGGYLSFLVPYAVERILHGDILRASKAVYAYLIGNKFNHYIFQRMPGLFERLFGLQSTAIRSPLARYLSRDLNELVTAQIDDTLSGGTENSTGLAKVLFRYLTRYSLPALLRYEDMNSMWFSVESRVPFLDHRLVEYALSLPANNLINGGTTKYILREAMRGVVPNQIIDRRDKIGFGNPESEWVSALIRNGFYDELISDPRAADIIDVPQFRKLLKNWEENAVDPNFLWRVFNVLKWQADARDVI